MLTRRQFVAVTTATLAAARLQAMAAEPRGPFRLSVMLWTLRPKYTAEQGIDLAAAAGYDGVELVDEDRHWSLADIARIHARMRHLGIVCDAVSGISTGFAQPGAASKLVEEISARIPQAKRLGCRRIILLSGPRDTSLSREKQHAVCIENLRQAAAVAARADIGLMLEPIDSLENPAIYLTQVEEAFEIARAVASPHVRVLYDIYHQARGFHDTGDAAALLAPLTSNMDLLGLIHIANVPGRHAPGRGNIDYGRIYAGLARRGYRGWVAMEFLPLGDAKTELEAARRQAAGAYSLAGQSEQSLS